MNEAFHGAFRLKLGPYGSRKYAGDDYEVSFNPNICFWGVLSHPDLWKNLNFGAQRPWHWQQKGMLFIDVVFPLFLLVCSGRGFPGKEAPSQRRSEYSGNILDFLKHIWKISEQSLRNLWTISETSLKNLWNISETNLKNHWKNVENLWKWL